MEHGQRMKSGAVAVLAAVMFCACGSVAPKSTAPATSASIGASAPPSAASSASPSGLTSISMDGSSFSQLLYEVAQNRGFFQREGLTATYQQLAGNLNTAQVISGDINYELGVASQVDPAIAEGAPLRWYGVWANKTTINLVGRPGVDTVQKLRDGTILTPGPNTPHEVWTKQLLRDTGGGLAESVKFDHVNSANSSGMIALLTSGQVAAAVLSVDSLFNVPSGYPLIYDFASPSTPFVSIGAALATRTAYAQSHPDQVKAVARALSGAAAYLVANQDGSLPFIEKIYGLKEGDAATVWKSLSAAFTSNPVPTEQQYANALNLDKIANPKMANLTLERYKADYFDLSYTKS